MHKKKDDKQLTKNYRPICAKLFERILFNNIYNYRISNNLITSNQSGFKPGDSTTNQLLYLRHVCHVFLDMSKAFDKVWHEGLLFKLKQNGISGSVLKLLSRYLNERKQRVLLNGHESDWGIVESGVPKDLFLDHYYFWFTLTILRMESNSKSIFFC